MSTARSRAKNYQPKIKTAADGGTAPDGMSAMKEAWDWLLSEIRQLEEHRPDDAEAARRHVAIQVGKIAELLPKRTRGAR